MAAASRGIGRRWRAKEEAPAWRHSNTTSAKPASNGKPVEITNNIKKEAERGNWHAS
jgi:hypothetical protein